MKLMSDLMGLVLVMDAVVIMCVVPVSGWYMCTTCFIKAMPGGQDVELLGKEPLVWFWSRWVSVVKFSLGIDGAHAGAMSILSVTQLPGNACLMALQHEHVWCLKQSISCYCPVTKSLRVGAYWN
jgi:hypothetical protein